MYGDVAESIKGKKCLGDVAHVRRYLSLQVEGRDGVFWRILVFRVWVWPMMFVFLSPFNIYTILKPGWYPIPLGFFYAAYINSYLRKE